MRCATGKQYIWKTLINDMKFAVISDTHDNFANIRKALLWIEAQGIDVILHCGDICKRDTFEDMQNAFKGEIKFVRGNGDFDLDEIPLEMELLLGDKKVFLNHYPERARKMAQSGEFDMVFYGHTHVPWEEKIKNCRVVNPGEMAGQRNKPTFARYDTETEKLELKILEKL